MSHIIKSDSYTFTHLVRWVKHSHMRSHLVSWQGKHQVVNDYMAYLNDIHSELIDIFHITRAAIDSEIFRKCLAQDITNTEPLCKDYIRDPSITATLIFASHPDIINWVKKINPKDLEIVEIPKEYKIIIRDPYDEDDSGGPDYEYILIPKNIEIKFL